MQFEESTLGNYRIFAGTLESPYGEGYVAALIVQCRPAGPGPAAEVFRDESLACGYRWETAEAALVYAMTKAREVVRRQEPLLAA